MFPLAMRFIRRNRYWRAFASRLPACVAIVAYLVAAIGLPLPVGAHKDTSQPFPCQNNPCGCQTAEECWTHCSCYTVEERWAWAREHNVEPPSYAERPADDGWDNAPQREHESRKKTQHRCRCCCEEQAAPVFAGNEKAGGKAVLAIGLSALHCHGLSTYWVSAGAVVPPPTPQSWSPCLTAGERTRSQDTFAIRLPTCPRDPPPRSTFN
jgi:hypothetical protein